MVCKLWILLLFLLLNEDLQSRSGQERNTTFFSSETWPRPLNSRPFMYLNVSLCPTMTVSWSRHVVPCRYTPLVCRPTTMNTPDGLFNNGWWIFVFLDIPTTRATGHITFTYPTGCQKCNATFFITMFPLVLSRVPYYNRRKGNDLKQMSNTRGLKTFEICLLP